MASRRYTTQELLFLRQSGLCVKPPNLPPATEWMGQNPDTLRPQARTTTERGKVGDGLLTSQENRRPAVDRNGSRSTPNPEEIILGPPRTSFASSSMRANKSGDLEKGTRDADRQDRGLDRFNFRSRTSETEGGATTDRFRDGGRDRNNSYGRRNDQDQDSDGWSMVRPRKSFGHEGAERFGSRMGGDRFGTRDDRRPRDRDELGGESRRRNLDLNPRDRDGDEGGERTRRNGAGRGRGDPWFKDNKDEAQPVLTQRERIDRAKSWRDRDPEDKPAEKNGDRHPDRYGDRPYERRWDRDRDQRVERDPEWLDEPAEEKTTGHTMEDFQKFMETMKKSKAPAGKTEEKPVAAAAPREEPEQESFFDIEPKAPTAAVETGPDKFFAAFGGGLEAGTGSAESKDAAKSKAPKSSRFMAFLTPQEEKMAKPEPAQQTTTAPGTPAASAAPQNGSANGPQATQIHEERAAFAMLIQKLHRSSGGPAQVSTPPAGAPLPAPSSLPQPSLPLSQPQMQAQAQAQLQSQSQLQAQPPLQAQHQSLPQGQHQLQSQPTTGFPESMQQMPVSMAMPEHQHKSAIASPEPFQQYMPDRREDPRLRAPQHSAHDILSPRPVPPPVQPPQVQPGPNLQDLLIMPRRMEAGRVDSRLEQNANAAAINSNQEFLMRLMMQSARNQPEPPRPEQPMMARMPQPTKQQMNMVGMPHPMPSDLEQELQQQQQRERHMAAAGRQMRNQGPPPGFMDDQQFHAPEPESRPPPQPTQILQRPQNIGVEHHMHPFPMGAGGGNQMAPPQPGRPMIPPPGFVNGPRNGPIPQSMFPPNFAPQPFPPPEGLVGPGPPRSMPPPPPGLFGGPPPPGFMPGPPPGLAGFPGPDGPAFPGGPIPFDRRGMMPPGFRGP